jgi:hypothetical protein
MKIIKEEVIDEVGGIIRLCKKGANNFEINTYNLNTGLKVKTHSINYSIDAAERKYSEVRLSMFGYPYNSMEC